MKRTVFFIAILLILCPDIISRTKYSVSSKCFTSGERIQYQVYYTLGFIWINAGKCEFRVKSSDINNRHAYKLTCVARSNNSFESFFALKDTFLSFVDSSAIVPLKAYKHSHEGNWVGLDEFTFREDDSGWRIKTEIYRRGKWKDPVEDFSTEGGFDILTSIYRLRCMNDSELIVKGKAVNIYLRLDDGEYKVRLKYLGKEKIKLHETGFYNTKAYELSLVEGNVFKSGDFMKLWVSDDKNKIPLMIESPIKVGKLKAVFSSAENTLFPMQKSTVK